MTGNNSGGGGTPAPNKRPNAFAHGWSLDVQTLDLLVDGQRQRAFGVTDNWSRAVIDMKLIENEGAIVQTMGNLVASLGRPAFLSCKEIPEFKSEQFCNWVRSKGIAVRFE